LETSLDVTRLAPARALRPMSTGDLLDRAIYFYCTHFVTLVLFVGIFTVPLALMSALVSAGPTLAAFNPNFAEENLELLGASYIVSALGSSLVSILAYLVIPLQIAGIGVAVRGFLLEGRQVSLREMFQGVRENFGGLLATTILGVIVSVGLLFTFIVPPVGAAAMTLFSFAFSLAYFVVLYEKKAPVEALRRGWLLVRGSIGRIVIYLVLYFLFSLLFGVIIGGLVGLSAAGFAIWSQTVATAVFLLSQTVATVLSSLLSVPLLYGVTALLYFDLRMRHEGLDIMIAMAQATGQPVNLADTPASTAPILDNVTWRAVGILAAGYTGFFVLFCGGIFLLVFASSSLFGL
jgi:hypothetical protein